MKVTKRYSHGFDMTASFTWQKTLALGNGASNGGATGGGINDMFNRDNQKIARRRLASADSGSGLQLPHARA